MVSTTTFFKRIHAGLCGQCGLRPLSTTRKCRPCADKNVFYTQQYARKYPEKAKASSLKYRQAHRSELLKKRHSYRDQWVSQGRCGNCGHEPLKTKWYGSKCLLRLKRSAHKWYLGHKSLQAKRVRNYRHGGLVDAILERDHHQCQGCTRTHKLVIDHIDENPRNNTLENQITLCLNCHVAIERLRKNPSIFPRVFTFYPK